jgi:hypothetical protein
MRETMHGRVGDNQAGLRLTNANGPPLSFESDADSSVFLSEIGELSYAVQLWQHDHPSPQHRSI